MVPPSLIQFSFFVPTPCASQSSVQISAGHHTIVPSMNGEPSALMGRGDIVKADPISTHPNQHQTIRGKEVSENPY